MASIIAYSIILLLSSIVIISWLDKKKRHVLKYCAIILYAVLGIYLAAIVGNEYIVASYRGDHYSGNLFKFLWEFVEDTTAFSNPLLCCVAIAISSLALMIILSAVVFTVRASSLVVVLISQLKNRHYTLKSKTTVRKAHFEYNQKRQEKRIFLRYCRLNN